MLVHGATADHSRWAPVLPALEEHFTVLAIDRRGRGRSGDANDYAIEREYEDVAAVIEWAGETVDVVGHSHGGVCALEAALLTHRVRKLVLYEPPMGFLVSPPQVVDRLEALLEAGEHDELLLEGGDSPEPFRAADRALLAALPDSRVAVMPGQRHVAMDTGTKLFTAEVLSFLEAI